MNSKTDCAGLITTTTKHEVTGTTVLNRHPNKRTLPVIDAEAYSQPNQIGHCPRLIINADLLQSILEDGIRNCRAGNIAPILEA